MPPQIQPIQWSFPEYRHQKKGADWFWAIGIIAIVVFIISLLYNNILFALFILIAAFTLMMYAAKKPKTLVFSINTRGVHVGNAEYSFHTLKSFWIHQYPTEDILIIESETWLVPYLHIPIASEISTEHIREIFLDILPEKEHHESLSETIMEYLGF
jgi:c-di-AMP phosphodiesterase-like protein